jgi:hypothetical protein
LNWVRPNESENLIDPSHQQQASKRRTVGVSTQYFEGIYGTDSRLNPTTTTAATHFVTN